MATVMLCNVPYEHYFIDVYQTCWNEYPDNPLIIQQAAYNYVVPLRELTNVFARQSLDGCFKTSNEIIAGFSRYGIQNPLLHAGFAVEYIGSGSRILHPSYETLIIKGDFYPVGYVKAECGALLMLRPRRVYRDPMLFILKQDNREYVFPIDYASHTTIYDAKPTDKGFLIQIKLTAQAVIDTWYIHQKGITCCQKSTKEPFANFQITKISTPQTFPDENMEYQLLGRFQDFFIYEYVKDGKEMMLITNDAIEKLNQQNLMNFLLSSSGQSQLHFEDF